MKKKFFIIAMLSGLSMPAGLLAQDSNKKPASAEINKTSEQTDLATGKKIQQLSLQQPVQQVDTASKKTVSTKKKTTVKRKYKKTTHN